jgi:hypothetical protein
VDLVACTLYVVLSKVFPPTESFVDHEIHDVLPPTSVPADVDEKQDAPANVAVDEKRGVDVPSSSLSDDGNDDGKGVHTTVEPVSVSKASSVEDIVSPVGARR